MTDRQKHELETIIRSLTNTLDDVEEQDQRINIHNVRQDEVKLIVDLLVNYLKKNSK